eukprot:675599_1
MITPLFKDARCQIVFPKWIQMGFQHAECFNVLSTFCVFLQSSNHPLVTPPHQSMSNTHNYHRFNPYQALRTLRYINRQGTVDDIINDALFMGPTPTPFQPSQHHLIHNQLQPIQHLLLSTQQPTNTNDEQSASAPNSAEATQQEHTPNHYPTNTPFEDVRTNTFNMNALNNSDYPTNPPFEDVRTNTFNMNKLSTQANRSETPISPHKHDQKHGGRTTHLKTTPAPANPIAKRNNNDSFQNSVISDDSDQSDGSDSSYLPDTTIPKTRNEPTKRRKHNKAPALPKAQPHRRDYFQDTETVIQDTINLAEHLVTDRSPSVLKQAMFLSHTNDLSATSVKKVAKHCGLKYTNLVNAKHSFTASSTVVLVPHTKILQARASAHILVQNRVDYAFWSQCKIVPLNKFQTLVTKWNGTKSQTLDGYNKRPHNNNATVWWWPKKHLDEWAKQYALKNDDIESINQQSTKPTTNSHGSPSLEPLPIALNARWALAQSTHVDIMNKWPAQRRELVCEGLNVEQLAALKELHVPWLNFVDLRREMSTNPDGFWLVSEMISEYYKTTLPINLHYIDHALSWSIAQSKRITKDCNTFVHRFLRNGGDFLDKSGVIMIVNDSIATSNEIKRGRAGSHWITMACVYEAVQPRRVTRSASKRIFNGYFYIIDSLNGEWDKDKDVLHIARNFVAVMKSLMAQNDITFRIQSRTTGRQRSFHPITIEPAQTNSVDCGFYALSVVEELDRLCGSQVHHPIHTIPIATTRTAAKRNEIEQLWNNIYNDIACDPQSRSSSSTHQNEENTHQNEGIHNEPPQAMDVDPDGSKHETDDHTVTTPKPMDVDTDHETNDHTATTPKPVNTEVETQPMDVDTGHETNDHTVTTPKPVKKHVEETQALDDDDINNKIKRTCKRNGPDTSTQVAQPPSKKAKLSKTTTDHPPLQTQSTE